MTDKLVGATGQGRIVDVQQMPPHPDKTSTGEPRGPSWLFSVISWSPIVAEMEGVAIQYYVIASASTSIGG